jgi:hypothetical protein
MESQTGWKDGIDQAREGDASRVVSGVVIAVITGIIVQAFIIYLLG